MTTYIITAPDGKEYEIDAPSGATQEDALAYFKSNWKATEDKPSVQSTPAKSKDPSFIDELKKGTLYERYKSGNILYPEEESAIRKILQGAASGPLMGAVQLGAQAVGADEFANKIAQNRKEGSIVGSLLQPEAWLTGGVASKLPTLGKQVAGMAGLGGAYGFLSPNESLDKRLEEGGISAGISGAIPLVGRAAIKLTPKAKELLNSISAVFTKSGRTSVGHKMVLDQLPVEERDEVLRILQTKGIDTSELGSQLTTSQALGYGRVGHTTQSPAGARVAALESEIAKMQGGEKLNQIYAQQGGLQRETMDTLSGGRSRVGEPLRGMSADDLALRGAEVRRARTANTLYPKGEVTGDARLNEIMSRPAVETADRVVGAAEANVPKSMITQGVRPADSLMNTPKQYEKYSLESLTNRYRSMETAANKLSKAGRDEEASAIRAAKNDLGEWLTTQYPEWAQANRMFAYQSVPVRQMEVGAELKRKMAQSPTQFLNATDNIPAQEQLIRSVTGRPNQKLTDIFNLGQMSKISGLRNEAQIADEVGKLEKMARANLGDETLFQLPNLLNVWIAVANRTLKTIGKTTVDDITKSAAKVLENPNELRKLLVSDALARSAANSPVSQKTLGRIAAPGMLSGGMMTGADQ